MPSPDGRDHISRLPTELLEHIGKYIKDPIIYENPHEGIKALFALSCASRRLCAVFEKPLYELAGAKATTFAAFHGNLDTLNKALSFRVDAVHAEGSYATGQDDDIELTATPFYYAIVAGQDDVIRWLIHQGVKIQQPLTLHNHFKLTNRACQWFIPHEGKEARWHPLHLALRYGHTSSALLLTRYGAQTGAGAPNPRHQNPNRERLHAIHCAVLYGNCEVIQDLVNKAGARLIHKTVGTGIAPIHIAAGWFFGYTHPIPRPSATETIKLLAELGANLELAKGHTNLPVKPLTIALRARHFEACHALLNLNVDSTECTIQDIVASCYRGNRFEEEICQSRLSVISRMPESLVKAEASLEHAILSGDFQLASILMGKGAGKKQEFLFKILCGARYREFNSAAENVFRKLVERGHHVDAFTPRITPATPREIFPGSWQRSGLEKFETCLTYYIGLYACATPGSSQPDGQVIRHILKFGSPDAQNAMGSTPIICILKDFLEMLQRRRLSGSHTEHREYGQKV